MSILASLDNGTTDQPCSEYGCDEWTTMRAYMRGWGESTPVDRPRIYRRRAMCPKCVARRMLRDSVTVVSFGRPEDAPAWQSWDD